VWTRVCIDLDAGGNVAGCSYELHDVDGPVTIWVGTVAPFDTPHEALDSALANHDRWQGTQAALF
jgi:hypothetical protein